MLKIKNKNFIVNNIWEWDYKSLISCIFIVVLITYSVHKTHLEREKDNILPKSLNIILNKNITYAIDLNLLFPYVRTAWICGIISEPKVRGAMAHSCPHANPGVLQSEPAQVNRWTECCGDAGNWGRGTISQHPVQVLWLRVVSSLRAHEKAAEVPDHQHQSFFLFLCHNGLSGAHSLLQHKTLCPLFSLHQMIFLALDSSIMLLNYCALMGFHLQNPAPETWVLRMHLFAPCWLALLSPTGPWALQGSQFLSAHCVFSHPSRVPRRQQTWNKHLGRRCWLGPVSHVLLQFFSFSIFKI